MRQKSQYDEWKSSDPADWYLSDGRTGDDILRRNFTNALASVIQAPPPRCNKMHPSLCSKRANHLGSCDMNEPLATVETDRRGRPK